METVYFEEYKIKTCVVEGVYWFCGKDVAKVIGYTNARKAIGDHVDSVHKTRLGTLIEKLENTIPLYLTGNQKITTFINKTGMVSLMTYSRMPNKEEFVKWYEKNYNIKFKVIKLLKEQETVGQLIKVFDYKNIKTQYVVGNYRIDLYFIDAKIAIECDEFGHRDREPEYEKTREQHIKKTLGCKFIRYNPDDPEFCIFDVIKEINIKLDV